jgi:hypothetical protein
MSEQERIDQDFAGWGEWARYTHSPSGDTLLRKPYMSSDEWHALKRDWLAKYPGVPIFDERGARMEREEQPS